MKQRVGLLVLAVAGGTAGCAGRGEPGYGVQLLNNTGNTVYRFGVDFGSGPLTIRNQLADGGWAVYHNFPAQLPEVAVVFWEAPAGARHERRVPVRSRVPAERRYVKVYLAIRADGGVEVVAIDPAADEANGCRESGVVSRLGRPADKPEPPRGE